jgi:hypothetical protein
MRGFGAMCLLRRSRCMFLAPQSAALRCPWIRALLVPVVRVPSCARGPPCVFFLLHMYNKYVQLYGTVVQYEKKFALLCFSSLPVSLLIPALRGLSQKKGGHEP